jgi:ubiquinone/menaquinone biosynthesis C-methylase UbiE
MSVMMQRYESVCETLRQRSVPLPNPHDIFVGDGDYVEISLEFLKYFIEVGKLEPTDSILDVGSGIGRMAVSLSHYLDPNEGRYLGLDPVERGVAWCKDNISSRAPNFRFKCIDVHHEVYNISGKIPASTLKFPIKDGVIDFVICTSVFSHLYEEDILNYLFEMDRVLSKKGRVFCTAYLFEGEYPPQYTNANHLCFTMSPMTGRHSHHVEAYPPLAAVAFPEAYFRQLVENIPGRRANILPGRWRGARGPWFQDVVLIE